MKLHYMGKYNLDPDSLPHGDHMPGAVQFKEAGSSGELGVLANVLCIVIMVILVALALICGRFDFCFKSDWRKISEACLVFLITLFPHELLHAVCFRRDVYLYTNLMQGMLFVVGPETMSKSRFIFMSLLPNLVFGLIPYLAGMIFSVQVSFILVYAGGRKGIEALIHTIKFMDNFYIFDNGMVRQFLITGSGRNISAEIWRTPSL